MDSILGSEPPDGHRDWHTVLEWNERALTTTAGAPFNPPLETRALAIVHAAVFDAVNSIIGEFRPYRTSVRAPPGASAEAAAVAAAHRALVRLFPAQQATLDDAYQTSVARIPDGASRRDGIAVGVAVAEELLAWRSADRAQEAVTAQYSPGSQPGAWVPTPPALLPALDLGWGEVEPFLLRQGAQYRPAPPPALASQRATRDLEEVRRFGSATSQARTPAQTDLARFWAATAPQNWNPLARAVCRARRLSLAETARILALLNLAGADALIAAWDAKFAFGQWRPVTAIRAADTEGASGKPSDASWTPLLVTPPFPDFIAGHTTFAGAAEAVLAALLGSSPGFPLKMTSPTAPGVVETYSTFEGVADDVVEARVLGGVHWRTSCTTGRLVGQRIGRYAIRHFMVPADARDERATSDDD